MAKDSTPSEHFSPNATLAAIGLKLQALELFKPVTEKVQMQQNTIEHTPADKLNDAFIAMLAGAHGICEMSFGELPAVGTPVVLFSTTLVTTRPRGRPVAAAAIRLLLLGAAGVAIGLYALDAFQTRVPPEPGTECLSTETRILGSTKPFVGPWLTEIGGSPFRSQQRFGGILDG